MRSLLWRAVWGLAFRLFSPTFSVSGHVPRGPVVFAPNHSSHADTAAMQLTLAKEGHPRVLAAGAEDYFFRNRIISALSRLIGVYPFPRRGSLGIERSVRLLASGWSVILFPQGTRSGGRFRPGIGHLARHGFTVVPVTITGTGRMLPKGSWFPKRSRIRVDLGLPMRIRPGETSEQFAGRVEIEVLGRQTSIDSQGVLETLAS